MDDRRTSILGETRLLRDLCKYLFEQADEHQLWFARNILVPEFLTFQVRHAHVADIGKLLMQLSFLVRQDYRALRKLAVNSWNASDDSVQAAYRTIFFDLKLDPWLLYFILHGLPPRDSRFQTLSVLPGILMEVEPTLRAQLELPPAEAFAGLGT